MKDNHVFVKIIIGIGLIFLIGCGSRERETKQIPESPAVTDSGTDIPDFASAKPKDIPTDSLADNSTEKEPAGNLTQEDGQSNGENTQKGVQEEAFQVPTLPDIGSGLTDFVPEGWTLWDSVELDFNEDGIPDYVGVLDTVLPDAENGTQPYFIPPRILFAIASDGTDGYCLDFQDINLIRTREEGGVYGDPYEPLTAERTAFTTHAYGGSAWKWTEENTYTYDKGIWYKTMSESTYGYGSFITSYQKDDWVSGVGIRKERSDDFDKIEKYWNTEDSGEEGFDVEYEVSLDEPITIYQAGKRWWLAPDRVTDWSVESIVFSEDMILSEEQVKLPDEAYLLSGYCDEDCVLYTFRDRDSSLYYLVMYRFQDRKLAVLAESKTAIDDAKIYKGKIYYSTEIVKEEDTIGVCLNRMNLDGSGKEGIFEYQYPGTEQEIQKNQLPYLSLIYEISGDEIIAEVYVGNKPYPIYRMGSDGSGLRQIGQIPAEK